MQLIMFLEESRQYFSSIIHVSLHDIIHEAIPYGVMAPEGIIVGA